MEKLSSRILDRAIHQGFRFVFAVLLLCSLCACGDFTLWGDEDEDTPVNSAPTAVADVVPTTTLACEQGFVVLDGTASSDPDGDTLTYTWSLEGPEGSSAAPLFPNVISTAFLPDKPGDYVVTLTVSDGTETDTDEATVTATFQPIADAGEDLRGLVGEQVVGLDGSNSLHPETCEPDEENLSFSWAFTSDPSDGANPPDLDVSDPARPSFTPALAGDYVLLLTVSVDIDGETFTNDDEVTVEVVEANEAPTAVADVSPTETLSCEQDTVTLNGSESTDLDGDTLTYLWSITTPEGSSAAPASPTAVQTTFLPDKPGDYAVTLEVSDGIDTDTDGMTVTASFQPIVDAGSNQQVEQGDLVNLDGTGSLDPVTCTNGDTLSYAWEFTEDPSGGADQLTGADTAQPSFTPTAVGDYVIKLTVSFDTKATFTAEDEVTVTVTEGPLTIGDLQSGDYELTLDTIEDGVFEVLGTFLGQGSKFEDRLSIPDPDPGGDTFSTSLPVNIAGSNELSGDISLELTWSSDQDESYTVTGSTSLQFEVDVGIVVTCTSEADLDGTLLPSSDSTFTADLTLSNVTLSTICQAACGTVYLPECRVDGTEDEGIIGLTIQGSDPQ